MTRPTIPPSAVIRPMTPDDIESVREIADGNDYLLKYHPYVYWVMRGNAPDLCKVYAMGERVLGYVAGVAPFAAQDACLLWQVGVHDSFRRRGIASALVEAFAASATERGFAEVQLTIDVRNNASRALFQQVAERARAITEIVNLGQIDLDSQDDKEDRFALHLRRP